MSPPLAKPGSIALLALTLAPLAACTTGRQFSIAMTNPGTVQTQTVLVVGEGDPASATPPTASAPSPGFTTLVAGQAAGLLGVTGQASAMRSQAPSVLMSRTSLPTIVGTCASIAATGQSSIAAVGPTVGLQVGAASSTVQVGVTPSAVDASASAPILQAAVSAPLAGSSTSVAAASGGLTLQASTPVVQVATVVSAAPAVQATLSDPAAALSASAVAGGGGVSLRTSALVASTVVAANPNQGLQAAVTSPASTLVVGTVASSAAMLQATLTGVNSGVALSAPAPATSTPAASMLKTLSGVATKKIKRS